MSLSFALNCRTLPQCCHRLSAFDAVRIILGVLLLAAAGLKGYQLATEPTIESSLLTSHWFLMAVVEWELLLGVWLLVGVFPHVLRWTALVWFVLLLGTSLSQAAGGARSCACFGFVEVAPWLVVIMDAIAVITLWLFQAVVKPRKVRLLVGRIAIVAATIMLYFGVAISGAAAMWQRQSNGPLLIASAQRIELGSIRQGEKTQAIIWLNNPQDNPVQITQIHTSCPCVQVKLDGKLVYPKQNIIAAIHFDSLREPDFSGQLSVKAIGKSDDGRCAFLLQIGIAVQATHKKS